MKMRMSTVPASRVFPLAGVFGDVAVSRRAALTMGWEISWPPVFSCDEDDYDNMANAFAAAIRVLPPWSIVHRQDTYFREHYQPDEESSGFLGGTFRKAFEGAPFLSHHSYLFITMAPRGLVDKSGTQSGLFGIGGSISVPSPNDLAAFRSKCSEFLSILTAGGKVSYRPLYERDWFGEGTEPGLIQRYMMMGDSSPVMSDVVMTPSTVSVKDKVMQAYAVGESDLLPGQIASVSKVGRLSTQASELWLSYSSKIGVLLPCEHVVNQVFVIPNQDEVLRGLEKEKNKMMSGIKSVDNRINGPEIAQFLDDQYATGMFLVRTHMNILAWDTEDRQMDLSSMISSALKSMNVSATYNNWNTPVLYYAGIPSNAFELGKENMMTMELMTSLCLMQCETFDTGVPGGKVFLCDRQRHIPVPLDMQVLAQAKSLITNYNMFILGGSGSGKSFCTNRITCDLYEAGQDVFIIDVGDSYEGQAAVHREESGGKDGLYLSWDEEHPLTFDPFAGGGATLAEDGSLVADEEGGNFFLTLLQTICEIPGGWTSERKNILTQTVVDYLRRCMDAGTRPTFDGYYRFFDGEVFPKMSYVSSWETAKASLDDEESAQKLSTAKMEDYRMHGYWIGNVLVTPDIFDARTFDLALKEYSIGGARGRLLNDPDPKDIFSSRFTVIEVDKLSKDDPKYYSVCILLIIHAMDVKMRSSGQFKTFIIEEAWKAIANETMAPYLRGLWKTARKFNTSACVVTQEVADIIDNPTIKTAIIDNSEVKILLDQSNHLNTFASLQKTLSLTDKDKNLILSINRDNDTERPYYREVFVSLGGKKTGVYATEVSREMALAFESNKTKKSSLLKLAKEKGSFIEAIKEISENQ